MSSEVLMGALVGIAAGALMGVMFAPDKGYDTRKKVSQKGEDYTGDLKKKFNEFLDDISEKFEEVKADVSDFTR